MIIESKIPGEHSGFLTVPARVADLLTEAGCATYLSVYIYAVNQCAKGNVNISNDFIAEALKISKIDVVNAFLFYSSQGLIKIHNFTSVDDGEFDIEFCFSAPCEKAAIPFKPSYKASEISRQLQDNPRMSQMYKMVGQILGKTLSSADTELLYSFHDYYGLPIEVILVLIEYYVSKGKRSMKYIEKEAGKWACAGVDSIDKAKAHIEKREEFLSFTARIRTVLGIQERRLTTRELSYIHNWQSEFNMSPDMVKAAYELTVNQTGKLSFAYMNKILESWAKSNIHAPGDIHKQKTTEKKDTKKSRYDFKALQRQAFEAVNFPDGRDEKHGV